MNSEKLKIPAYLRKKDLAVRAQKQLLLTALDRKRVDKIANSRIKKSPKKTLVTHKLPAVDTMDHQKTFVKLAPVGKIIAYYSKIEVAILELTGTVKLGDTLQFSAKKFLFQQKIESMQIDREEVKTAKKGETIGLKIACAPEVNTEVYKLLP